MSDSGSESKRDRFRRLATLRTNEIINRLRILGNCSSKNNYIYTEAEVEKIFKKIDQELDLVKAQFKRPGRTKFEL